MARRRRDGCDTLLVGYEDEENLGLRSIAAYLASHGIRTGVQAYDGSSKTAVLERVRKDRPALVGFSLIFQRMVFDFADLIAYLRREGVAAHFTMGGHFPTLAPEATFDAIAGLDSIVRHEGEHTLLELFQQLQRPRSWARIRGLAYRRAGGIRINPPRPLIQDLDSLPFPVRWESVATHRGLGVCSIVASRGCYYDCSFCSVQQFYGDPPGSRRRTRSPGHVAEEMQQLFDQRGVRIFIFKDDELCTRGARHRGWIDAFARELKRRRLGHRILWRISCRVDEVDGDVIAKLQDVGLRFLYLGIESGNNQGLRTFNKHYQVKDIHRALGIIRRLGLTFQFGFMIFDPDSTLASIRRNVACLERIGEDGRAVIHFTKMLPYVGTPIARRLEREGRLAGTIASPNYDYADPRVGLAELLFARTFSFRNFHDEGLVNRLQLAAFDVEVVRAFFAGDYDADAYARGVQELTRQCNAAALEAMSIALRFLAERPYDDALAHWPLLESLARREQTLELRLAAALHHWMSNHGLSCAC